MRFEMVTYLPLDQSAANILGLFQKKNSFILPFWGTEEDLRGTSNAKIAPNFGTLLGGHVYCKTGLNMRFLAKVLAAVQSNATYLIQEYFSQYLSLRLYPCN